MVAFLVEAVLFDTAPKCDSSDRVSSPVTVPIDRFIHSVFVSQRVYDVKTQNIALPSATLYSPAQAERLLRSSVRYDVAYFWRFIHHYIHRERFSIRKVSWGFNAT